MRLFPTSDCVYCLIQLAEFPEAHPGPQQLAFEGTVQIKYGNRFPRVLDSPAVPNIGGVVGFEIAVQKLRYDSADTHLLLRRVIVEDVITLTTLPTKAVELTSPVPDETVVHFIWRVNFPNMFPKLISVSACDDVRVYRLPADADDLVPLAERHTNST